jgi:MFS transporter, YNFM family, putative membrane transport protein
MRRPPTVPVVLAGAAAFLDLYATQPLLPLLSRTFDASAFQVGLTITAPTVAVALFAPLVGRLADRAGLRRVIVSSATVLAATTLLAATSHSLTQLILWRFAQGIITPGIFASTVAYIHEVWPPDRAGRATAAYVSGTVIGGFTGRAVAGLVASDLGWHGSFVALAGLNALAALALWWRLPAEPRHPSRLVQPRARRPGSVAHLLANRRLVAAFGVGFCVLFTQVAIFTYVTFYLAAPPFRLGTVALSWLFVVYLVGAVVTPFAGALVDRYGHRVGIGSALAIAGAGALLTLAPSLAAIVTGLALAATGVFVAQATTSSFIGAVTTRDRALAVGLYSALYYAGGSAGAALPALVWSRGGWPACIALVSAVQVIGLLIALTQWSRASTPHDLLMPEGGV